MMLQQVGETMQAAKDRGVPVCCIFGGGWELHKHAFAEASSPDQAAVAKARRTLDNLHASFMMAWRAAGAVVLDATRDFQQIPVGRDLIHYSATAVTKNGRLPVPTALRRLLTKCALQAAVQVGIVHWPGLKAEFAAMTLGSDAAASPAAAELRPMRQLRLRSSCLFGERKALRGATLGQCYSG